MLTLLLEEIQLSVVEWAGSQHRQAVAADRMRTASTQTPSVSVKPWLRGGEGESLDGLLSSLHTLSLEF